MSKLTRHADEHRRTWIHCPTCRKPTYTHVRFGDVEVWCKHCRAPFEVVIRPPGFNMVDPATT